MNQRSSVFISSLLDEERMPFATSELVFGRSHYSWKLIAKLYVDGLNRAGIQTKLIARPEIYQAQVARTALSVTPQDLHIAVKQVEHLRPFYGIPNLFICGWEFPEFFEGSMELSPFTQQLAVLRRADRVLCWTDFTRDNLLAAGVSQALTLPPPILPQPYGDAAKVDAMQTLSLDSKRTGKQLEIVPFGERMSGQTDPVLLAIINPFDKRKMINTLLHGALKALDQGYKFVLMIKLIIDGKSTHLGNINEILDQHFALREISEQIIFCTGELNDSDMVVLRARSDFHISAASAEGLNLPLVEAALQDIPIITTQNTAMASYMGPDDAVWITCDAAKVSDDINAFASYADFTHFPPTSDSIATAIGKALGMSLKARTTLAKKGRKAVEARFGQDRFEADFRMLTQELLA
ncbi:MAG: hypothetical protein WBG95_13620 [Sulfitobacter sp.]